MSPAFQFDDSTQRRRAPFGNGVLEHALLSLRKYELLQHPNTLDGQINGGRTPDGGLHRLIVTKEGEGPRDGNEGKEGLAAAVDGVTVVRQPNLAINDTQIEENEGLLKVDVLLRGLLLGLKGVKPDKCKGVDVVQVGVDWEVRLYEGEGFEVGLEEVATCEEGRIKVALEVRVELL
ncbi:hypothetical protein E2542_SST24029 [Spatholobus suberectus]|nr:hypothetical protein E2542_SST24029 [Spatholobus suberectus]